LKELNKSKKKALVNKIVNSNNDKVPNRECAINTLAGISPASHQQERNFSHGTEEEKMSVDELSIISSDSISSQ
jgi:hypothetical protein